MTIPPDQIQLFAVQLLAKYRQNQPRDPFWRFNEGTEEYLTTLDRYLELAKQINPKQDLVRPSWLRQLFTRHIESADAVDLNQKILDYCCRFINGQNAQEFFGLPENPRDYAGHYCVWWTGSVSNLQDAEPGQEFDVVMDGNSVQLTTRDGRFYSGGRPSSLSLKLYLDLINKAGTERVFFILHVGEATNNELDFIPGIFSSGDSTNTIPCSGPVLFVRKGVSAEDRLLKWYFTRFRGNSLIKACTISDVLEARRKLQNATPKHVINRAEIAIREKHQLLHGQSFYLYYYKTFEDSNGREDGVGRAILRFADSGNVVTVQAWTDGQMITYTGSFYLVTTQTLSMSFQTETQERDLSLKFRIGTGRIYPFALGVFSNFGNQGEPVAGTALLEYLAPDGDILPPIGLRKSDPEYSQIHPNIARFFINRRFNMLTTRVKGIFSHDDFASFFKEQENKKNTRRPIVKGKSRVFIASPVSSQIEDFEELRPILLEIVELLRHAGMANVYYAGEHHNPEQQFALRGYLAAKIDFKALEESDHIFMVHPRRVQSSSLVEIGYALGQGKMCHIFFKDQKDLPFLLRGLQHPNVRYLPFEEVAYLPQIVQALLEE